MTDNSVSDHTNAMQQLALLQLADSFFPSGSYTLSHGLESLVQSGDIKSATELETFIRILLCNKIGSTDLVALSHAHCASSRGDLAEIERIDALLYAQTPVERTRTAQRQSGRALLMVAAKTWENELLDALSDRSSQNQLSDRSSTRHFNCLHPIIFAVVAQVAGLNVHSARLAFVHSFVTGLLGAGIRLGSIGHSQAQRSRLRLSADMTEICDAASVLSLDEMWSCTPMIDLAQMRQAKLSRRLFAS